MMIIDAVPRVPHKMKGSVDIFLPTLDQPSLATWVISQASMWMMDSKTTILPIQRWSKL